MHRLVQLSTRIWLRSVSEEEKWQGVFLSTVYKEFPTGDFVNWAKCQSLLPHIEGIKETIPDDDEKIREWVGILANAAWYLWTQGLYGQAEGLIKKSVAEQGKISRSDDISAFRNQSIYALVLSYQGKYEESEALNRRALAAREKALGVDHPDTLTSIYCLAYLLHNMKQYDRATELYQRACFGFERVLGRNHPTTLSCFKHYADLQKNLS
jgi:tetratricopeptide (TPR) repeat protein